MRIIILFLSLVWLTIGASAQTASKIRLQNPGFGKVTLIRNKTRVTIDLSRDVAGCAFASAATKKMYKDCSAPPAQFQLIDATVKNNETFLLIASEASGNCNVCGNCGADSAFALIWLRLDRNLRVLDRKSTPIDYCRLDVFLISDALLFNEDTQEEKLKLIFTNDRLALDFEKKIFEENPDRIVYEFSHLEYNRKTPEKGFIIKTEKREQSSVPEN